MKFQNNTFQKIDASGDSLWCKYYGGEEETVGTGFELTDDGNYIYCGYRMESGAGDVYIAGIDSTGHQLWEKQVGGENWDVPLKIIQTSEGGYLASGFTNSSGTNLYQGYAIKLPKEKIIIQIEDVIPTKTFGGKKNEQFVDWGEYNPEHIYSIEIAGTGSNVNLRFFDGKLYGDIGVQVPGWYGDNSGSFTVEIWELP